MGFVFIVIAGVIAFIVVIIWLVARYEKKRTESLSGAASGLGLEFSAASDDVLLEKMQVFSIFNKGHSRKMKNVMKAETEIANLAIFDYQYTTGGGQHQQVHSQTMVAMESDSLSVPNFNMRPEGLFDKFGSALGFQDIDFDDHPEFSKAFVLQGENEGAIREFFDKPILDFLAQRQGIYIESAPGIFIYRHGGRKKPGQIREFMDDGFAVYSAFVDRVDRS